MIIFPIQFKINSENDVYLLSFICKWKIVMEYKFCLFCFAYYWFTDFVSLVYPEFAAAGAGLPATAGTQGWAPWWHPGNQPPSLDRLLQDDWTPLKFPAPIIPALCFFVCFVLVFVCFCFVFFWIGKEFIA